MEQITQKHKDLNKHLTGMVGIAYNDSLVKDQYDKLLDCLYGPVLNPDDAVRLHRRGAPMLVDTQKYLFAAYRVLPVRKPINPRNEKEGYYVSGVRFLSEKPVKHVVTEWRYVKDCLAQLEPNFFTGNKQGGDHAIATMVYLPVIPDAVKSVEHLGEHKDDVSAQLDELDKPKRGRKPNQD